MLPNSSTTARYSTVFSYTGSIVVLVGVIMLTPLLALPFYPEEARIAGGFLLPAAALILLGMALRRLFRRKTYVTLTVREGAVIVLFTWLAAFAGAPPPSCSSGDTVPSRRLRIGKRLDHHRAFHP